MPGSRGVNCVLRINKIFFFSLVGACHAGVHPVPDQVRRSQGPQHPRGSDRVDDVIGLEWWRHRAVVMTSSGWIDDVIGLCWWRHYIYDIIIHHQSTYYIDQQRNKKINIIIKWSSINIMFISSTPNNRKRHQPNTISTTTKNVVPHILLRSGK